MVFVFAVVRVAIDNEVLLALREPGERHVHANSLGAAHAQQVLLRFQAMPGLPRFDGASGKAFRAVREGEMVVDGDNPAEAAARRTRADRVIKTEERRGRLAILEVARGAMKAV